VDIIYWESEIARLYNELKRCEVLGNDNTEEFYKLQYDYQMAIKQLDYYIEKEKGGTDGK
jgi:hypothetical protein